MYIYEIQYIIRQQNKIMKLLRLKYKKYYENKKFLFSIIISIILLIGSLIVSAYAVSYATEKASNAVTDIILSNTQALNVDAIFIYGPIFTWFLVAFMCVIEPKQAPFILKSLALFVLIRSAFVSLTHLGVYPAYSEILTNNPISRLSTGYDLFFSGHTGSPFLMALIFWQDKVLRYFFLFLSVFFGAIVLLGHYHYSIDVFAAFFITFAIYHMASFFFKKDKLLFKHGL